MADDNVLEEFLINVLYNVDERKRKDFNEGLTESFVKAKLVGDALEAMAVKGVAAIERYVNGMERLYYVSRNTGASVQNLQALGFAAAQLGGNAEDAVQAVEGLVNALKSNPGRAVQIRNLLGVETNGRDPAEAVMDVVHALAKLPAFRRMQLEPQLGITEQQFLTLNNPDAQRQMDRYKARQRQMGIDPQQSAADAAEFMRAWRDIGGVIDNIASTIMSKIVHGAAPELTRLSDYLAEHGPQIADVLVKIVNGIAVLVTKFLEFLPHLDKMAEKFGGWDKVLLAVGAALLLIVGNLGLLSAMALPTWLLAMLGVGLGAEVYSQGKQVKFGALTPDEAATRQAGTDAFDKSNWNPMNWGRKLFGGGGGGTSGKAIDKMAQGKNVNVIAGELRKAGYNENAIAAIVGSMQTESSFNPNAHNNVGGGHSGLWQWDGTRWPKIAGWIKQQGGDPADAAWQTRAWIAEHNAKPGDPLYDGPKTAAGGALLRNNPTLEGAVHGTYLSERFGPGEEGGRANNARNWLPHVAGLGHTSLATAPRGIGDGSVPPMPANMPVPRYAVGGGVAGIRRGAGLGVNPTGGASLSTTNNAPVVNNHFDINGAVSPAETAKAVHDKQADAHANLARNMRNGVG